MNDVHLSGFIASDLELRKTQQGISVTSFRVAVRRPRNKDDITDFIDVVCWGQKAEFVTSYFRKGSGIELRGTLTVRKFTDKNGNDKRITEVIAEEIEFPKAKKESNGQDQNSHIGRYESDTPDDALQEDLPF